MNDAVSRVIQELFFSAEDMPYLLCIPLEIPLHRSFSAFATTLYILFSHHVYVYPVLTYCTGPR